MLTVRPCANQELASVPGLSSTLPSDAQVPASESVSLMVSNDNGSPIGGLLLAPLKRIADKVLSYRVAWLQVAPEYQGREVECLLLREGARLVAVRGAKSLQVAVRPRTETALAICGNIAPVSGVSVVVSLQHDGI